MNVEIAICTWNRAELLGGTLDSITRLDIPASLSWRVIVVDNGSTDETESVVRSFSTRLNVLLAKESRPGHTFARNRAIEAATGDLLLWTDDDVIVDSGWLSANLKASQDDRFDFWGGRIRPVFLPSQPTWIAENWEAVKGCFAERDLGDRAVEFDKDQLPYGANFAIRTELQKRFAFDVSLGRRGSQVLGQDEIELMQRLLGSGYRGQWVPESSVQHVIPAERSTMKYVGDYFVGQGQRIYGEGSGWSTQASVLWRHWKWESFLFWLKRKYAQSPAVLAHLIRSGLAQGQYLAAKSAAQLTTHDGPLENLTELRSLSLPEDSNPENSSCDDDDE